MKAPKFINRLVTACLCAVFSLTTGYTHAQQGSFSITGTVSDPNGEPIIGATVLNKTSHNGVATDMEGKFALTVSAGNVLNISYLGYDDAEIKITPDRKNYSIILHEKDLALDEVVVVGYGTQKKETLSGAVSSISNKEIITTKNENVQNMLTGKIAGLRVRQNSSEPGTFETSMDIRGFGTPLVVIDGVPRDNMSRIDPEDIETISVLKDASAAIYGVKGGNGVVLITTKKGSSGKTNISYSGNVGWQKPSNFPNLVSGADWMTLYNEKYNMHNVDATNPTPFYSVEDIAAARRGDIPSYNWLGAVFRDSAPQTQHTVSASGGNDRMSFYTSLGYQYQESFLKNNPVNYDKYTMRSNISAKIADGLTLDVNLGGHIDKRTLTSYGTSDIVRSTWLFTPLQPFYYDEAAGLYHTKDDNASIINPLAMADKDTNGWQNLISRWLQSSVSLRYDAPFLKGLYAKGFFSYDYIQNDNKFFKKAFDTYTAQGKPTHFSQGMTDGNYSVQRNYYGKTHVQWHAQLGYDQRFGNHAVSGMVLFENTHKEGDNFYGSRELMLPVPEVFVGITETQQFNQSSSASALYDYAYQSVAGRFSYAYDGKYLAEFIFRYDGSSRFPAGSNRWGFFPSASVGWRVSQEKFWQNSPLKFIENFKIRGSYGKTGDDSGLNYEFLTGYNYPVSGNIYQLPGGSIFGDNFVNGSNPKGIANRNITWYTMKTWDIGVDLGAWNNRLTFTFDWFKRTRDGLYATRNLSLPGSVGASLPKENLNSDCDSGFEIELGHHNRIGDFSYSIKGNISYTRRKTLYYEQAKAGNSYLNWRQNVNDRYNNIWWGYGADGRITDWNQIYYSPVYIGRGSILGDYLYEDWNGDGMIDDLDVHPIADTGLVPLLNFGVTLSGEWKGIDLSMLFQGAGNRYITPREFLLEPLWSQTNAIAEHMDRWHPADPQANPYDPSTKWIAGEYGYTGSTPNSNSEHALQNARYLRLKNIELGYTLPYKWTRKAGISNVRFYVSGYNLITFSGLKYLDPEFYMHPTNGGVSNLGYYYPINKTYTVGLNVKF
ncbi:MAG: TonB-dependent receptor [Duncaniella sp.]|nr:TonB-dependent receptor [Duncaniella sp.]